MSGGPVADSTHLPVRPAWTCRTCEEDWPCAERRGELATERLTTGALVAAVQAGHMVSAVRAGELSHLTPSALHRRFLGEWLRAPRPV